MVDISKLKPGDEVTSWCTKCHELRTQFIKVLVPGKVPRVVCDCDGRDRDRNYRPNPPKSRTSKKKKEELINPWPELNEQRTSEYAKPYTIQGSFFQGEVIDHRKYGIGFVIEILDTNKMSIAFEDKRRIMIFGK